MNIFKRMAIYIVLAPVIFLLKKGHCQGGDFTYCYCYCMAGIVFIGLFDPDEQMTGSFRAIGRR
jgi:hypothetical protein